MRQVQFHGTHQIEPERLQAGIATQASVLPTNPRVPLVSRFEYFDPTTFRRDLERVERTYSSQGFYGASITDVRIAPDANHRMVDLDITVREGERTLVGTLWLSGCDDGSPGVLTTAECATVRSRLRLQLGGAFTEQGFAEDRELLRGMLEDLGRASPMVRGRVTVDPEHARAHVVFVLDPGPESYFGVAQISEGDGTQANRDDRLPSGYPLRPVRSALGLAPGTPYARSTIAAAQRRIFDLGAFGIVRITPTPVHCRVGQAGCELVPRDAATGTPIAEWMRVDLTVQLSPKSLFFQRFGVGAETDQLRSSVRASWRFEWRNAFGGMRRLSGEVRPQLFLPSIFGNQALRFDPGVAASLEFRQPEVFQRGSVVAGAQFDVGPDPFNPNRTSRVYLRPYAGVQFAALRNVFGAVYVRGARVQYYGQEPFFHTDPIYSAQYIDQTYLYLEGTLGVDQRDNALATRSGVYARAVAHAAAPIPGVSPYGFVRGLGEVRAFLPLGSRFTLAVRGSAGLVAGLADGVAGWPVPQELRFYSGGANSNRGYPFNRAGPLATVPRQTCVVTSAAGDLTRTEDCNRANVGGPLRIGTTEDPNNPAPTALPDNNRILAVGGLGLFELSIEGRAYFGNLGIVGFIDISDAFGWVPPAASAIPRRPAEINADAMPALPPAPALTFPTDLHPSVGVGLRYISPIGVIRLDVGLRVDDLGCTTFDTQVAAQQAAAASGNNPGYPTYFATSRPPCNLLGAKIPAEIAIAIGEAY